MQAKISQEWELRGYSCDLWVDEPGQRWEDYKHNVDELFMLLEGVVELEIDGKTCKPQINEVVYIPAHSAHSVRNIGKKKARWLYGYKLPNVNERDMANFNK